MLLGASITKLALLMDNIQVVPDTSSTIGDPRENAEVLVGNHMDIGRMSGPEDPNYDSVVGELRRMHSSIVKLNARSADTTRPANPINVFSGWETSRIDGETEQMAVESGTVGPG